MDNHQLFFGFKLTKRHENVLDGLASSVRNLFIQNQDLNYLQLIHYDNQKYLGKYVGNKIYLQDLKSTEIHIQSILRKLSQEFSEDNNALVLLAISA